MAVEQHGNAAELQQLEAQSVVSIRATIPVAELGEHQGDRLRALSDFLRQRGIQPAGPPFVRYHTFGEIETDVELGIPLAEPVAGEGRIATGELPGGPAVTTWHIGAHDRLGDAYARIAGWLQSHGGEPAGASWEVYHWIDLSLGTDTAEWPDPSSWRTQLIQPIKESPSR